ncbi:hypothetical protein F7725_021357 [Dissostichus mawsoni]|uniref:Caskin C-terminal domain-containing protein n=1 Tax=Dissostichus mawsoni TaxID=36200 RepID=A0A7J5ZF18_DISMA|nr:hypothetical protein F7725_021357 [Dissostichus mawsoni]
MLWCCAAYTFNHSETQTGHVSDPMKISLSVSGHQKKLMLAVKRLCDLQRSRNHADRAGGGTLQRKPPAALELVAIEYTPTHTLHTHTPSDDCCPSPRSPRTLLSFQDSELSAELQSAMMGRALGGSAEAFSIRVGSAAAMYVSQESISTWSRGSGNSNSGCSRNPWNAGTAMHSEESGGGEEGRGGSSPGVRSRYRPSEMLDRCRSATPNSVPFAPLIPPITPSKMPRVAYPPPPPNTKHLQPSSPSSPSPQPAPTQTAFSYLHAQAGGVSGAPWLLSMPLPGAVPLLAPRPARDPAREGPKGGPHKKRAQSLTRYALSDGEPDEEDYAPTPCSSAPPQPCPPTPRCPAGRAAGTPAPQGGPNTTSTAANHSQREGPPPVPPKRMSSVSGGPTCSTEDGKESEIKTGLGAEGPGIVKSIAARLEGGCSSPSRWIDMPPPQTPLSPVFLPVSSPIPHILLQHKAAPALDLEGLKRTNVEPDRQRGGAHGRHLERELGRVRERKPRHQAAAPGSCAPPADAEVKTPTPHTLELPEFNLKESDTVKRRHRPRDKDSLTPEEAPPPNRGYSNVRVPPPNRGYSDVRVPPPNRGYSNVRVPPPNRGYSDVRVPPPNRGYSDVRVPPLNRGYSDVRELSKDPAQGPGDVFQREGSIGKGPSLQCPLNLPVLLTAPQTADQHPPRKHSPQDELTWESPESRSQAPAARRGPPSTGRGGAAGLEVLAQQRLEQTSTSLEEALKVVENKGGDLCNSPVSHSGGSSVKAAGNILDDISNMFDDLADQLDAMLE